jgi:hypothetical protein
VGNHLDLAGILVRLVYQILAERRVFTIRSSDTVRSAFGISSLDVVNTLLADPVLENAVGTFGEVGAQQLSLFWRTVYDLVLLRTGGHDFAVMACLEVYGALKDAADNPPANGTVLTQFRVNLFVRWDELRQRHPAFAAAFTQDTLFALLNVLQDMESLIEKLLSFSFKDLDVPEAEIPGLPLVDETFLRLRGVYRVTIPQRPEDFLGWGGGDDLWITLHLDEVVLADESELTIFNPRKKKPHEEWRFPLGGSIGDIALKGVDVTVKVRGELGEASAKPFGPYHRYQDAYWTDRNGANILRQSVNVDEVDLNLHATALTVLLGVLAVATQGAEAVEAIEKLERAIKAGIEGLEDLGGAGDAIRVGLLRVIPNASAVQTHDFFRPFFTDRHASLVYRRIGLDAGLGHLHISNEVLAREPGDDPPGGGHHLPTDPEIRPPDILDEVRPGPGGSGGGPRNRLVSPTEAARLSVPPGQRAGLLARLEARARSGLPPAQEAASRLLVDGLDVQTISWLRPSQIDRAAGTVAGRAVSPATLRSLDRLRAAQGAGPSSLLFAPAGALPSTPHTLTLTLPTFGDPIRQDVPTGDVPGPAGPDIPEVNRFCAYSPLSTLAASRGSAVDPAWIGLSLNCVALNQAVAMLEESEALQRQGSITWQGTPLSYTVQPEGRTHRVSCDLREDAAGRPGLTAGGLKITVSGAGEQVVYRAQLRVPAEVVKGDPGCLPDDAVATVTFNRGCLMDMLGGRFTDQQYLEQLLYRHFLFLRPVAEEATAQATALSATAGSRLHAARAEILPAVAHDLWRRVPNLPVLFDPYFALAPTLREVEIKDGWLNVYETYAL